MRPFKEVTAPLIPLDRVDVDTDQIIPKQFLKRIERTGYGDVLFHGWRYREDGSPDPEFVLNHPAYAGGGILLGGRNFGCGSSREHAAWALSDFGIRVVVAPSFADIFYNNCFQNGILPVVLEEAEVRALMERALREPGAGATVELEGCTVRAGADFAASFALDPFRRRNLLEGLDEIGLTLLHEDRIGAYEEAQEG